ncbi:hypothetical protein PU02_0223 [Bartonella ancashensis]|uniref:Uncharacterized protein n=1 Tax=Bartonella ancashensis TaxID=1318743 RepID=A0A0M4M2F1_9HYPH|nr:hypothetical protein PU02_0223 [Bartonella ancashensis]
MAHALQSEIILISVFRHVSCMIERSNLYNRIIKDIGLCPKIYRKFFSFFYIIIILPYL